MLRFAPKFYEVAKRIVEITNGCILIAHNSSFDYRILKTEFNRIGYNFEKETLCTVELSKKLIPNLESYSLGRLCRSLGIAVADRHRASGDALATVKLFKLLLSKDVEKLILKKNIRPIINTKTISEKLNRLVEPLKTKMGIFYLYNIRNEIIYLKNSKNIKNDVLRIFLGESKTKVAIQEKVQSISVEETGNFLISKIKYTNELLKNKPKYNKPFYKYFKKYNVNLPNMLIVNKGRNIGEKSVILIENNTYMGYGFFDLSFQINSVDMIKNLIGNKDNSTLILPIIEQHLKRHKTEKIIYLNTWNIS